MGPSAIQVIRISGPRAHDILVRLTGRSLPPPRTMARRWVVGADQARIDDVLIVCFDEGASFTGERMAEIQCHGGRAVVTAISEHLAELPETRLAAPGEFTRRALENGNVDLSEAQGIADLISAETDSQREQALRIMSGELGRMVETWREKIIRACSLVEVSIDWVDEDVPVDVRPEVAGILSSLIGELTQELNRAKTSQRIRTGFEVAILGAPNTGKSTLVNFLAGRDAAIVSDIPGTTRDIIEVRYDLHGVPVTFLDTAGLRETDDLIEASGVSRAVERAQMVDLRIILTTPESGDWTAFGQEIGAHDLVVNAMSDRFGERGEQSISAKTGRGIDRLLNDVHARLGLSSSGGGLLAHMRHEQAVSECKDLLMATQKVLQVDDFEILAEKLRAAATALEVVVGRIDTETLLDAVFGSFCLGK